MKREKMQELYHEILDKIIIYLYQIKDKFNEQSEIDYYSFIVVKNVNLVLYQF